MGSMRFLIPLLICATSALYVADKVVGGPYAVNPAARSVTIGWVVETTPLPIACSIVIGTCAHTVPVCHTVE